MRTIAPMLTKRLTSLRYSTSTYLTITLIGGIVLINSVAWGIPLIVGPQLSQPPADQLNSHPERTKILIAKRSDVRVTHKIAPVSRNQAAIPLPQKAPSRSIKLPVQALLSGDRADSESASTIVPPSRVPTTLFPRPESAPSTLLTTQSANIQKEASNVSEPPHQPGETVFASPYTPGVRISARDTPPAWSHLSGEPNAATSTLATAKAIARRAAQRFEQMRDRMARLDTDNTLTAAKFGHQTRSVLPVAPRPPRIIDSGGRNVSKSASSFVRPKLVRRPLPDNRQTAHAGLTTASLAPKHPSTSAIRPAASTVDQSITSASTSRQQKSKAPAQKPQETQRSLRLRSTKTVRSMAASRQRLAALRKRRSSRRIASIAKKRVDRVREKRIEQPRSIKRRLARRTAKRRLQIARITRVKRQRSRARTRRSPRRINGFRRKFHRDLVMAGFFQSSR